MGLPAKYPGLPNSPEYVPLELPEYETRKVGVHITGCSPGPPQIGICNGFQNSGCPGNIKNIGCPHPHKSELGDGTHGAGPLRVDLYSNSFANNLGMVI